MHGPPAITFAPACFRGLDGRLAFGAGLHPDVLDAARRWRPATTRSVTAGGVMIETPSIVPGTEARSRYAASAFDFGRGRIDRHDFEIVLLVDAEHFVAVLRAVLRCADDGETRLPARNVWILSCEWHRGESILRLQLEVWIVEVVRTSRVARGLFSASRLPSQTTRRGRLRETPACLPDRGGHSIVERVAAQSRCVEVGLDEPGVDDFAAALLDRLQRHEMVRRSEFRSLREIRAGSDERIFAGRELTFGDRPGAVVFVFPERAAGVDEEEFERWPCGAAGRLDKPAL